MPDTMQTPHPRKFWNSAATQPLLGTLLHGARRRGLMQIGRGLLVASLVASPLVLDGQESFRNLTGTVTDGHHEPLKGAVVQVENEVSLTVISYITGRSGTYSFKRLDGNTDYHVWATFRDQRSKVKELSQFTSDKPKIINFVIKER